MTPHAGKGDLERARQRRVEMYESVAVHPASKQTGSGGGEAMDKNFYRILEIPSGVPSPSPDRHI